MIQKVRGVNVNGIDKNGHIYIDNDSRAKIYRGDSGMVVSMINGLFYIERGGKLEKIIDPIRKIDINNIFKMDSSNYQEPRADMTVDWFETYVDDLIESIPVTNIPDIFT